MQMSLHDALTYGLLTLALIALWLPIKETSTTSVRPWQALCLAALGCGVLFGQVQLLGLLPIAILGISCYCTGSAQYSKSVRIIAGTIMLLLSIALSLHLVPGFSNPKVIDKVILSKGAIPYSKYLNFDKTLVGLFVLGFTFNKLLARRPQAWWLLLKKAAPISALTILVLLLLSFAFGYVRFEPKWSALVWFWVWSNLFFTCIAEEALYRGVIQRYLVAGLTKYRYGAGIGLVVAAMLFGLRHYAGGVTYIVLSTVAGLGYGWVYLRTERIEAGILTHFLLNCIHFVFFTYPALASAVS